MQGRNWNIIFDVFFPPSLTSHTTTSPISPKSFNLSLLHSLLTVTAATTSVQAIMISYLGSYYSNFLLRLQNDLYRMSLCAWHVLCETSHWFLTAYRRNLRDPAWCFLISLLSWRHLVTQVLKYSQLPKYTKLFCPIPTHCPLCLAHFHQPSDLLLTVSHFAGRFFTVWATEEAH